MDIEMYQVNNINTENKPMLRDNNSISELEGNKFDCGSNDDDDIDSHNYINCVFVKRFKQYTNWCFDICNAILVGISSSINGIIDNLNRNLICMPSGIIDVTVTWTFQHKEQREQINGE